MMDDKLVTIASFTNNIEAELAKQTLADAGIEAVVSGANVANLYGPAPGLMDLDLQVFEEHVERAREILGSGQKQEE